MVRGMEFSSNGDVEQNNGGAADWQEVMQGVKQGVRIHQLYRCFFLISSIITMHLDSRGAA